MRFLIVSMLFAPDHAGIAPIASDLARGLQEKGHEVTVYTTHPYYPEWRRKSAASPWRVQEEVVDGVRVRRFGIYVPATPSRLLPRLLHELSFPISLARSLFRRERFDAVVVFCPLLGAVVYAALRKLVAREPLWVNVQDIPVAAALGTGIGGSGLFSRWATAVQDFLFHRAEVCSSISPAMVEGLRSPGREIQLHPNWLGASLARHVDLLPDKVGRLPGERIKLLYAGNIGKKQGLLEFCQVLATTGLDFEFQIHGEGGEAAAIRRWVDAGQDPRFRMGGFLEEDAFVQALHATDLFVITERTGCGASFMPSKLIPCIASATPVLCLCDRAGSLGREVEQHDLGLMAEWHEAGRLTALIEGCRDAARFRRLQENCTARARLYRRDNAIASAERLLEELARREPGVHTAPASLGLSRRSP